MEEKSTLEQSVNKAIRLWVEDNISALIELTKIKQIENDHTVQFTRKSIESFEHINLRWLYEGNRNGRVKKIFDLLEVHIDKSLVSLLIREEINLLELIVNEKLIELNEVQDIKSIENLHLIRPIQEILHCRAEYFMRFSEFESALSDLLRSEGLLFHKEWLVDREHHLCALIAKCYVGLNDFEKANEYLEKLTYKDYHENYEMAGDIACFMGDYKKAKEYYTNGLNRDGRIVRSYILNAEHFSKNSIKPELYLKRALANEKLGCKYSMFLDLIFHLQEDYDYPNYRKTFDSFDEKQEIFRFFKEDFNEYFYKDLFRIYKAFYYHEDAIESLRREMDVGTIDHLNSEFKPDIKDKSYLISNNDNLVILDTETTGIPVDFNAPVSNSSNWPRLVQLAYAVYNSDGLLIKEKNFIIKPEDFIIPQESTSIHGITHVEAIDKGFQLEQVLVEFISDIESARKLIGHNIEFDLKIIGAELYRKNIENNMNQKKITCTMKSSVNFCKIPGRNGYKWPTLTELGAKLFSTSFKETHNAIIDVRATAKCYWELLNRGIISRF